MTSNMKIEEKSGSLEADDSTYTKRKIDTIPSAAATVLKGKQQNQNQVITTPPLSISSSGSTPTGSTGNLTPLGRNGLKEAPVCRLPALRKEHMSAKKLSEFCFNVKDVFPSIPSTVASSTSSETALENPLTDRNVKMPISPSDWSSLKKEILKRTESRNGRDFQRFANDPQTGHLLRLTTGTVPILKGGRILLISSGRNAEWILPKGGWESDESLEISALRETYEEGGIIGVLGPNLKCVEYETRKAKKRRLDLEMKIKKLEPGNNSSNAAVAQSENSSVCATDEENLQTTSSAKSDSPAKECLATKIRDQLQGNTERPDDTSSIASSDGSTSCAHIRMNMSPLYVLEVREHWPESGRARKVVDIDTAIEMTSSRPEFQQVLVEVKEKRYHLNVHNRLGEKVINLQI